MSAPENKAAFARQSLWMVAATFTGGLFMIVVHPVALKMMPKGEYDDFWTVLKLMALTGLPAAAIQTIFARQRASATTAEGIDRVRASARTLAGVTFLVGALVAAALVAEAGRVQAKLELRSPVPIYLTAFGLMMSFWLPIATGLLQGGQHFGGLGWLQICNGFIRLSSIVVVALLLGGTTGWAVAGVTTGSMVTLGLAMWLTWNIWRHPPRVPFHWKPWLEEAIPLTFGYGTILAMQNIDGVFIKLVFGKTKVLDYYAGGWQTGFAILQFIAPIALVMFARVARSVAGHRETDSMRLTLYSTVSFGVLAAVGCSLLPWLPLYFMYFGNQDMLKAAPLVPWFAWALLPLTAANVLVQNVLAKGVFRAVPWLVAVVVVYIGALFLEAPGLRQMQPFEAFHHVVLTLGLTNLSLCAVGAWFSRGAPAPATAAEDPGLATAPAVSGRTNSPAA